VTNPAMMTPRAKAGEEREPLVSSVSSTRVPLEGCPACGTTFNKGDTYCGFCGQRRVTVPLTPKAGVQIVSESSAKGSRSVAGRTPERAEMENWLNSVASKTPQSFRSANSRS